MKPFTPPLGVGFTNPVIIVWIRNLSYNLSETACHDIKLSFDFRKLSYVETIVMQPMQQSHMAWCF